MAKINIVDHQGHNQQVDFGVETFRAAMDKGYSHALRMLDNEVFTGENNPTASQQVYAAFGLHRDDISLKDAQSGMGANLSRFEAATTQNSLDVQGRLAVQAYLMDAIEDKLRSSDYGILGLFNKKAATITSIPGTKFDIPIINYDRPEAARTQGITQLSEPASMMLLTVSDRSYKISGSSIGIEVSDQAQASWTLPLLQMSLTRQSEVEALEKVESQLLSFYTGDVDLDMPALSTITGAVKNAKTDFDSTLTAGKLSQKAWVGFLFNGSRKRRIDTVITDLAGALAIEGRSGRPTVQGDNATSKRIDTLESVVNPTWPDQVDVIISQDPNWPANTIVALDSRYAYAVYNSTSLSYSAVESYAIRRSTRMRFDSGQVAMRLFNDAWSVLTLT